MLADCCSTRNFELDYALSLLLPHGERGCVLFCFR
uniref:Uncharacterized protein n=1 Tax=Anguilla anguilla TaxID=7936 RepID=A0A0E9USH1_ANGAN